MSLFVNVHFDAILLKTFINKILGTLPARLRSDVVEKEILACTLGLLAAYLEDTPMRFHDEISRICLQALIAGECFKHMTTPY